MEIAAFTALSGALTSLKTIIDIAKAVNNQQLNAAVLDVQGKLIDVQQQALALQQENQRLRDQLQSMNDLRETAEKLRFDGRVYWKRDTPEFPFCPTCWDIDQKLVRLQLITEDAGSFHGKQISEYRCLKHQMIEVFKETQ
jgi:hypothetical protein